MSNDCCRAPAAVEVRTDAGRIWAFGEGNSGIAWNVSESGGWQGRRCRWSLVPGSAGSCKLWYDVLVPLIGDPATALALAPYASREFGPELVRAGRFRMTPEVAGYWAWALMADAESGETA